MDLVRAILLAPVALWAARHPKAFRRYRRIRGL
jgi:hypothetical protein